MERQQLKLGDKVKMKLVQPAIICSGRKEVVCYYKGIVDSYDNYPLVWIKFKRYGEEVRDFYDLKKDCFYNEENKDIKIQFPKICCFD